MDTLLLIMLALTVLSLVVLLPRACRAPEEAAHRQTLADMQQITNNAKADITRRHRVYRAELAQRAKATTRRTL